MWSHVSEANLKVVDYPVDKFLIFLSPFPECGDNRQVFQCQVLFGIGSGLDTPSNTYAHTNRNMYVCVYII